MFPVLLACTSPDGHLPLAEIDVHIVEDGRWALDDGAVLSRDTDGLRLSRDGQVAYLAEAPLGDPALDADGLRFVVAHRDDGLTLSALDAFALTERGLTRRRLVSEGSPDRVALSDDGTWVAYVSGLTGIASVWAMPFEGGEATQLTNVGIEDQPRIPGQPPAGFVPPPHTGPLHITDDQVTWESPEGRHAVALP